MTREIKALPKIATSTSFDGKHHLVFNETTHRYKLDYKSCPGVTSFIKAGYPTSMGLIKWFQSTAIQYTADWFTERTKTTLQKPSQEELKELFKAAKSANEKTSQQAADIGSVVHDFAYLTELNRTEEVQELQNKINNLPIDIRAKVNNGIGKFLLWKETNQDEMVSSETIVASAEHVFSGKFDRLARRNGKLVLSDFKTSGGLYLDQFIQLGAYTLAIKSWLGLDVEGLEILRFGKENGEFETLLIDKPKEIRVFQEQAVRCRETYEFRKLESDERWKYKGK